MVKLKDLKVKPIKVENRRGSCGSRCGCGEHAGQGA